MSDMPDVPAKPAVTTPAGTVPAEKPVPAEATAQAPAPQVTAAAPETGDSGLTADEERELGRLQEKMAKAAGPGMENLRVTGTHTEMSFGGTRIGREWTPVPARAVPHIMNAAATAGVEVERQS
jgi:hypothetical protein